MMNRLLSALAEICAERPLEKKYLVVPSFQVGRQLGDALAAGGSSWVNLHCLTLPSLAEQAAGPELASRGTRLLSGADSQSLVDQVFRQLKDAGRLAYFGLIEGTAGTIEALQRAIFTLRLAGLKSADLQPSWFINERKGAETALLLRAYERALEAANVEDLAGLYDLALKVLAARPPGEGEETFMAFAERPLASLERRFLETAARGRLVLLPQDPVFGLVRPRRAWEAPAPGPACSPAVPPSAAAGPGDPLFSWLFDTRNAPSSSAAASPLSATSGRAIDIFSAVGPANECREILRRLLDARLAFDSVEIIHPPTGTYPAIIHALAAKSGFSVTLADGLPIAYTMPGKVFSGLLDWLEHDYYVSDLCELLETGAVRLPRPETGEPPSPLKASRYLKRAMIGWGRDRYLERLQGLLRNPDGGAGCPPDPDDESGAAAVAGPESDAEIGCLIAFVREALALFPVETDDGRLDFGSLCRGAAAFVDRYASVRGELDAGARSLLVSRLEAAGRFPAPPLKRSAALERLESLAAGLRAGASGPEPGSLHLSSWRSGGFSGRPLTFVVGLDQGTFPGSGIQDPVLLDEEREKIAPSLPTSADGLRENLWAMAGMLAGLRGRITLSYSAYDIIEERTSFPSSLILQAARLRAGDPSLDYSSLAALVPEASGFLPGSAGPLDETDWWLARLAPGGVLSDGTDAVKANFGLLGRGIFARERRGRPKVGEYEGRIAIDPREVHPLHNPGIVVSASRLELLAKCPFSYFLKYVLEVSPPPKLELDRTRWLSPLDRGALLHEIFARFMKALKASGGTGGIKAARHAALMKRITDEVILEYRRDIPPPSDCVFDQERREIEEASAVFLKSEEGREDAGEPLLFEVSFGCGAGEGGAEEGRTGPATLDLGGGRVLRLAGRIDRIDRVGPGRYRVIDYKTGSYGRFEEVRRFGRGRALQPALYAVAAEQLLKTLDLDRTPRIVSSGFSFPTRKGEGHDVMVVGFDPDQDKDRFRAELKGLLGLLLDVLENGHFVVNPRGEGTDCEYCDYGPVCGGTAAREAAKDKKDANPDVFDLFDKLRDYD